MARQVVSEEIKAAALADLQTGEQPAVVAQRYGLKQETVRTWKSRLPELETPSETISETRIETIRQPTVEDRLARISDLVLQNLEAKLVATQRIAEYVTRDEWLAKQNATDVAELYGMLDRTSIALLDRLAQRSDGSAPAGE